MEREYCKVAKRDTGTVEEEWRAFRDKLIETVERKYGKKRVGGKGRMATEWWNDDIKAARSERKRCLKVWIQSRREKDFEAYRNARRYCKHLVKLAKAEVWKRYGEHLSEISKTNPREFYKQVNRVRARDEEYAPSAGINDADGKPIHDAEKVKLR